MKILCQIPEKKYEENYLHILASELKIPFLKLRLLKEYFKTDFYLFLNIFEKDEIKFLSIEKLNDIVNMIKISEYIDSDDTEEGKTFEQDMSDISKILNISINKSFQLYEKYKEIIKNKQE